MYVEILNFEIEVMNILQTRTYEIKYEEKVLTIKNWLGREVLQFIDAFTYSKKIEACKRAEGLLGMLNKNLNHNIMKPYYHCDTTG